MAFSPFSSGFDGDVSGEMLHQALTQTRMAMCVTDPNQPDNPIVYVNEAFEHISGYPAEECIGRNCRFLQGPDTDPQAVRDLSQHIRDEEIFHTVLLNYRKDGSTFWNALHVGPVYDSEGRLAFFFGSQWDITNQRRTAQRLATSEATVAKQLKQLLKQRNVELGAATKELTLLKLAVESVTDAVIITDHRVESPGPRILYVNNGFTRMTGYSSDEAVGRNPRMLQGPQTDRAALDAVREDLAQLKSSEASAINYRRDGTPFIVSWIIDPVMDDQGNPTHWVGVLRDTTEHNSVLQQQRVLDKEIYHRIKNLLSIIGGVVTMTARSYPGSDPFVRRVRERIDALGASHDAAYKRDGEHGKSDIHSVIERVLAPYSVLADGNPADIQLQGDEYLLNVDQLVPITMYMHELVSNALHHGALSRSGGSVRVNWHVHMDQQRKPHLTLTWSERNPREVSAPAKPGLGIKLLGQMALQLNAQHELQWLPKGLRSVLSL